MTKVIVYIEGNEIKYRNQPNPSVDNTISNIVNNIINHYGASCELTLICNHYHIHPELSENSLSIDRQHENNNTILELDLGVRHQNICYNRDCNAIEEHFMNYINDDIDPSQFNTAIELVKDADIFIAVNSKQSNGCYMVLSDNLPSRCKSFQIEIDK